MGRPSKLRPSQWAEIDRRYLAGEKAADLAREFGVHKAAISRRVAQPAKETKRVANQLVAAEQELRSLPVAQQLQALTLADELRAISMHMAGAAKYGAATAHRLAGVANGQVDKIDDANPMNSQEVLQGISALTKMANDAATIPTNMLAANKELIRDVNSGANQSKDDLLRELAAHLPN